MISFKLNNVTLELETNADVFSPSNVDKGTLAMLNSVEFHNNDKLLDLGCGYGFIGIYACSIVNPENITMCDISENAIKLSQHNAMINGIHNLHILQSDGLNNISENNFSLILSNPPYHADFSVPKEFIEDGYKKLAVGGRMYMVTKRKDWYKNKLISIFGGVKITEKDGYYIFMAEKHNCSLKSKHQNTHTLSRKLLKKQLKMKHQLS